MTIALSVTGVTKKHGMKAVKWLRDRNLLSFYSRKDQSLNAFEFKYGKEWTYKALESALEATK